MKRRTFLFTTLASSVAHAHDLKHGDILIGHAWALPADIVDGQVFFPLLNRSNSPDRLIAARSDICGVIEFRRNNRYDDPPENAFELPPRTPIPMRPTARHLRLIGLRRQLRLGAIFPMILDFEAAGEVEINVFVEAAGQH